jgi:hypothetical protein
MVIAALKKFADTEDDRAGSMRSSRRFLIEIARALHAHACDVAWAASCVSEPGMAAEAHEFVDFSASSATT